MSKVKNVFRSDMGRLISLMFVILIVSAITHPKQFYSVDSFRGMGRQVSEYGLMSIGVAVAMISGGIDLSTVYIANLSGIIAATFMGQLYQGSSDLISVVLGSLIGLSVGMICGLINGFIIAYLKVPPMLATLGTFQLFMGIAIVVSQGQSVGNVPEIFSDLGRSSVFGLLPFAFVVFLLVLIIMIFVMSKTIFGKRVSLVGTNIKAAKYAGIRTENILLKTYMLSGIISGVAGLLSLARISSAKADFGSSYTMQTILISVLGGVNPDGGFGTVQGVGIAAIILQMISSYLNLFPKISNYYRDMFWGVALLGVLVLNVVLRQRRISKLSK